jgi:hypothetical protein
MIMMNSELSCGISMGWVGVFSGGLVAEECRSKYGIKIRHLLGGVCFGIFIGVPLIYGVFVFVTAHLRVSVHLVQNE